MFTVMRAATRLRAALAVASLLLLSSFAVAATSALADLQAGFRQIHDQVSPAVVSINSQAVVEGQTNLFDYFFGSEPPRQLRSATGSGVIIQPEGIVLTNSHVVQDATKVTIQLSGSDKQLPAEVVQTDPRTDLAIVRITEKGTYPTAKLGDASAVKVGDIVTAFGSPFGLATTMTTGVISATGRQLRGPGDRFQFSDLLQTDAPINPGNSGGPLVNIGGEVVGINFAIYSPGDVGGSVGIGFAIPINSYTRDIIMTLVSGRAFERGRLGIYVRNLDAAMREAYGVPEDKGGVLVDSIVPGQAAEKSGLRDEDIILSYNGTKVTDQDQFVQLVERTAPGSSVPVIIVRGKKEQTITVTVGGQENATTASATVDEQKLGMTAQTLTPQIAQRLRLSARSGVVVTAVQPGSPADEAGLQPGDIIVRVGASTVNTAEEFWSEIGKGMTSSKTGVLLRVRRGERGTSLSLPPIEEQQAK